ncbi:hypothetical protein M2403_002021 [Rahnella sp. BIGb0603]|uniref:NUMOD4 motif-containing HNH endonuclease n=1 Tax=Rahnella sp. BIGb0603 TaxID=2940612 RepID=UPI0021681034|nr:NUMOD4 motif-containing HNH endonuclease [Rahnella sp. BIGb0603]MCS3423420.1 hypothetical protein [Rahnella sp. BIGb0603]
MMSYQVWKDVVGYEGLYKVTQNGDVISMERVDARGIRRKERKLKPALASTGYLVLGLTKNGKSRQNTVHRMVAEAFIPNPENKPQVNHIDGIKSNPSACNLEWVTSSENNHHAVSSGLKERRFGCRARNIKWRIIATDISSGKQFEIIGLRDMVGLGLNNGCVYQCIHGVRKQHKGFTFRKEEISGG